MLPVKKIVFLNHKKKQVEALERGVLGKGRLSTIVRNKQQSINCYLNIRPLMGIFEVFIHKMHPLNIISNLK